MIDRMLPDMAEATRLTRAGKLMEATALIQRVLRGETATNPAGTPTTIDAEYTVVEGERQRETPGPKSKIHHEFRPHASLKETVERVGALSKFFREGPHPAPEVPEGASFTTATYTNAAGTRKYGFTFPPTAAMNGPQ